VRGSLARIAENAKEDRKLRFTSVAHLLTPELLLETWAQMNHNGASGVDGEARRQGGHRERREHRRRCGDGRDDGDRDGEDRYIEDDGYTPIAIAGKLRLTVPVSKTSVSLDVESGKSYFVRFKGFAGTIERADEAQGRPEIAETKLQENLWRGK
jgi:hypothetical protein